MTAAAKSRPFLPNQRTKGSTDARQNLAAMLTRWTYSCERRLAECDHTATGDLDAEFVTGSMVFLEQVRADLIAAGHMTADDFPPVVR